MKVKTIVMAVAAAGIAVSGSVFAASNSDAQLAKLQQQVEQLQSQVAALGNTNTDGTAAKGTNPAAFVRFNSQYSQDMLNNQNVMAKELTILKARQSGQLVANSIYLGGKAEMYAQYQRLGSANGNSASNSTSVAVPYTNVAFTTTIGDWLSGYINAQVSNPVTNNLFLNDAYFIVGNLNKAPFYFFGGTKVVDFGNFNSVNTVMPSLTRTAFMATGAQLGAGITKYGVTATLTGMNGGGISSHNSQTPGSQVNNFAANVVYNGQINQQVGYHVGTGYINGTGFSSKTVASATATDDSSANRVGAWDANLGLTAGGFALNGEFVITTQSVRGLNSTSNLLASDGSTNNLYAPNFLLGYTIAKNAAFTAGKAVKAYSLDGSYTMPVLGHDSVGFASYSQLYQNNDNNIYQFTVGARTNVIDTLWVGATYNLAGGKLDKTSLAASNTVLLDATAYF